MNFMGKARLAICGILPLLLAACGTSAKMDYTAFKDAKPRSILVLPPINHTQSINATNGFLSQMTYPLAEGGYYVVPVDVELETFHQNGVSVPDEMAQISAEKLHSIFGADAALYSTVTAYGSRYTIINSVTVVSISAKLVDLKTGSILWSGEARADDNDGSAASNTNIFGKLVGAAIKQIGNSISDSAYPLAGVASGRLLATGTPNGLLYGPRSPYYDTK